jgi:hypothetical protein
LGEPETSRERKKDVRRRLNIDVLSRNEVSGGNRSSCEARQAAVSREERKRPQQRAYLREREHPR